MFDWDFNSLEIDSTAVRICSLFYFLVVLFYWRKGTSQIYPSNKLSTISLFFIVLIFSIISWTNGDWIHYYIGVKNFTGESGREVFYDYLIESVNQNYFLFRLVIWGCALLFFSISILEFKVDLYKCLFFLFVIFINYFDYARASLGMATYFMGLSLVLQEKKIFLKVIGLAILLASYFFHKSMVILIVLTPFCFIPINKKTVILLLVALVLGYGILHGYFDTLLANMMEEEGELAEKIQEYSNSENRELVSGNIFGRLLGYWQNSIFYVIYALVLYIWLKYELNKTLKIGIKSLLGITTGILILSSLFYFFNDVHIAFFYRVRAMMFMPLTILSVSLYDKKLIKPHQYRFLFYYCGGYVAFNFLYRGISGV